VRAGAVTVTGPQAVLVSNNAYETSDIAGLGRRARLDAGTLGVVVVTVNSAMGAAGLLGGGGVMVLAAGRSGGGRRRAGDPGRDRRRDGHDAHAGAVRDTAPGAAGPGAEGPPWSPPAQAGNRLAGAAGAGLSPFRARRHRTQRNAYLTGRQPGPARTAGWSLPRPCPADMTAGTARATDGP
jgi:hypothetical protein